MTVSEIDFIIKLAGVGGNGLLIGALLMLGRWYLPRLDAMVASLQAIAVSLSELKGSTEATKQSINAVRDDVAEVKEDISGLFAVLKVPQPSRQGGRRSATGGARA